MDLQVQAFLRRLIEGRGPTETVCLLISAVSKALHFGGVSRSGKKRFLEELAKAYARAPRHQG